MLPISLSKMASLLNFHPLSMLVMEVINSLIAKAEQGKFSRGFKIDGRGEEETQV